MHLQGINACTQKYFRNIVVKLFWIYILNTEAWKWIIMKLQENAFT